MACRGVHFAITDEQLTTLLTADGDEAVRELIEQIEEAWDEDNLAEVDKAWDAIHRCLTDGQLKFGGGPYPLSHCVLGPRQLHKGGGYIVSLVLPNEVLDLAKSLGKVSADWFKEQYRVRVPADYAPEYGDVDRDYTWSYFEEVRDLVAKAAERRRAVIFTVAQ